MSNSISSQDQDPDDQESLNKLEQAILEKDPQFQNSIQDLTSIANENLSLDMVDIDTILSEQKAKTIKARVKRLIGFINARFLKISMFIKWLAETFVKETLPEYLQNLKNYLKIVSGKLSNLAVFFKGLKRSEKIIFIFLLVGVSSALFYFMKVFKGGIIRLDPKPIISSIEDISEKKYFTDGESFENFYSSSRFNQNLISLRRMVVNLQVSKNSSSTPMVAVEFFLQGNSSDVLIEVSDRESEIQDLLQGEVRTFSYDELDSFEGKNKLTEKLKTEINQILARGKISKVYFKTFILKR